MSLSDQEITLCFAGDAHPGWFCKECTGYAVIDKGKVRLKLACKGSCAHKADASSLASEVKDLLRHAERIDDARDYVHRCR